MYTLENAFNTVVIVNSGTATVEITMKSVGTIRDFYSFGIYGRDFNLDGNSAAGYIELHNILIAVASIIAIVRNCI